MEKDNEEFKANDDNDAVEDGLDESKEECKEMVYEFGDISNYDRHHSWMLDDSSRFTYLQQYNRPSFLSDTARFTNPFSTNLRLNVTQTDKRKTWKGVKHDLDIATGFKFGAVAFLKVVPKLISNQAALHNFNETRHSSQNQQSNKMKPQHNIEYTLKNGGGLNKRTSVFVTINQQHTTDKSDIDKTEEDKSGL